jgi:hypothetical protein
MAVVRVEMQADIFHIRMKNFPLQVLGPVEEDSFGCEAVLTRFRKDTPTEACSLLRAVFC